MTHARATGRLRLEVSKLLAVVSLFIVGEELQALAKEAVSQPPQIIARMKKLLGE